MKVSKKLVALLLAVVMVLSMSVVAFAADGSITIDNTTVGKDYSIFKVFDAQYKVVTTEETETCPAEDKTVVVYTYSGANAEFLKALGYATSPFTVEKNLLGTYNVSLKSGVSETAIVEFLSVNAANLGGAIDTKTAEASSVTFTGLDYGYYYISSSLGTAVTLDSAIPTAVVHDKNQKPANTDKVIVEEDLDTVIGDYSTAEFGETIYYAVSLDATNYDGASKIVKYIAHDELVQGLKNLQFAGKVTVNGEVISNYTDNKDGTVTIPWVDEDGNHLYPANSKLCVYYSAVMDGTKHLAKNKAWYTWVCEDDKEGKSDEDIVVTEAFDIEIDKYVYGSSCNKLAEAKFVLYKLVDGEPLYFASVDGDIEWVSQKTNADFFTTNTNGFAQIVGLDLGTYYLEEIAAPVGYNALTEAVKAELTKDTVSYQKISDGVTYNVETGYLLIEVPNSTGMELPETGGMGTTIFYVIGGLLLLASGVLFITKKRMSVER